MKQIEKIAEAYAEKWFSRDTTTIDIAKTAFIDGTKYQKEKLNNNYVVFQNSTDGLEQLSNSISTLEKAKEYVKAWKNKTLYIYQLIE